MSLDADTLNKAQFTLQQVAEKHQSLTQDIDKLIEPKQRFEVQLLENKAVLDELKADGNAPVYKLVGPALLPVSHNDAVGNVGKRLEFIEGKLKGLNEELTQLIQQRESAKEQFVQLQVMIQKGREQMQRQAIAAQQQQAIAAASSSTNTGATTKKKQQQQ